MPKPTSSVPRSRWFLLLLSVWGVLALLVAMAVARGDSLRDDVLALPSLGLFVSSALLGSRAYAALLVRGAVLPPSRG